MPEILLGSTVIAALTTAFVTALRASAAARRDHYAEATAHLAAWTEFPYRVRRRTSDEAVAMTGLADRGHELQEASARHRGWTAGESRAISLLYDAWLTQIQLRCRGPLTEAWEARKVGKPSDMNLNGFGPGAADDAICALQAGITYRFGWRRLLPDRAVEWRLKKRNLFPSSAHAAR